MKVNDENIIELRKRFVNDYNIPIQIFKSPLFEERLELTNKEYNSVHKYNELIKLINNEYNQNPSLFLDYYYKIRDNIINNISKNEDFIKFNNLNSLYTDYPIIMPKYTKEDIYTEDMNGKILLSIDLRKANYQALKFINPNIVYNTENYEDLIEIFTKLNYIKESKYTRQVIFGKLNPKKTIYIEKYLICKIYNYIQNNGFIGALDGKLINISSDELIYEISLNNYAILDIINDLTDTVKDDLELDIKAEIFKLDNIKFNIPFSDSKLTIYKRKNLLNNLTTLKKVPVIYYPQIIKLLSNKTIDKNDLIFFHEKQLVSFLEPISLT